ncbi:hypothetical protein BpHYR1_041395 [Brachionus plicatilis]|uniref:Uncharacterized protein n=1 Tax=Brachionus plicatilis TaxID=10195 RepID=A0A3M7QMM5_BRAPC|nr:hypothetical protein BpHYR1_041395 [Brachionus plicatilis]
MDKKTLRLFKNQKFSLSRTMRAWGEEYVTLNIHLYSKQRLVFTRVKVLYSYPKSYSLDKYYSSNYLYSYSFDESTLDFSIHLSINVSEFIFIDLLSLTSPQLLKKRSIKALESEIENTLSATFFLLDYSVTVQILEYFLQIYHLRLQAICTSSLLLEIETHRMR